MSSSPCIVAADQADAEDTLRLGSCIGGAVVFADSGELSTLPG